MQQRKQDAGRGTTSLALLQISTLNFDTEYKFYIESYTESYTEFYTDFKTEHKFYTESPLSI